MEFTFRGYNSDTNIEFKLELSDVGRFDVYYIDNKVKFNDNFIELYKVCDKLTDFDNFVIKDSDNFFSDCIDDDAIYEKWDMLCDIKERLEDLTDETEQLKDSFKQFKSVFFDIWEIEQQEQQFSDKARVLRHLFYALQEIDLPDGY